MTGPAVPNDSPRYRVCICTTSERQSGRYFRACLAHERPEPDPNRECHHTAAEGCNGHGDF